MIYCFFTYKLVCYKSCKCPRGVFVCLKGERRGRKQKNPGYRKKKKKKGGEVSNDCVLGRRAGRAEPGRAGFVGLVGWLVG